MSIIPAGFTRLDNETDVVTLLSLPNALAQPYLFLLTRARLRNPAVHWGEVAAAINRSQTQTHAALRSLKGLGLADEAAGMWLATRREIEQKPAEVPGGFETETRREPADNPTETLRKPAMSVQENTLSDEENQTLKEGTEGKKEQKEVKDPPTPQGVARESAALVVDDLDFAELLGEVQPPIGGAADAASPAPDAVAETESSTPEGEDGKNTSKPKVPRRAAAPAFDPLSLELPASVSAESWAMWCQHRREIKKPLTPLAAQIALDGLAEAAEVGWEPAELIKNAVQHRWIACVFKEHKQPPQPAHVVKFTPPSSTKSVAPEAPRTREEWLS